MLLLLYTIILLNPQYVRRQYRSYSEDRQTHMLVFDQDVMVLDLPTAKSKPKVIDGWKILPLTHPQVQAKIQNFGVCTLIALCIHM